MHRIPRSFAPGARDVQAQRIAPTLHAQRWSMDAAPSAAMSRVIQLFSGRGELSLREGSLMLRAPDVVWLPAGQARSLRLDPGSEGLVVGVSDALLAAAIGEHADTGGLLSLSRRLSRFVPTEPARQDELRRSLAAIEAEARESAMPTWQYVSAHLTIVLVTLSRLAGHDAARVPEAGTGARRLQQFRQLVEAHFREHWTVARYAAELNMSPDRLHDLCVRTLERPPLALVHQRLVREACLLLTGTDQSVERLAADLGFSSASHFSRLFKRWMAVGPRSHRLQSRAAVAQGRPALPTSYADWP